MQEPGQANQQCGAQPASGLGLHKEWCSSLHVTYAKLRSKCWACCLPCPALPKPGQTLGVRLAVHCALHMYLLFYELNSRSQCKLTGPECNGHEMDPANMHEAKNGFHE